jgi:tetratricopeptide (TPR) repeat protein
MRRSNLRLVLLLMVACIVGTSMLAGQHRIAQDRPKQLVEFNDGLRAYRNGQNEIAVEYFQKSIDEYNAARKADRDPFALRIYRPSRLYAGQAHHYRAKALIKEDKLLDALAAFVASQQINPGDQFDDWSSPEEIRAMTLASFDCKRNMERFLQQNPRLAEGLRPGNRQGPNEGPSPINDPNQGRQAKGRPKDDI